MVNAVAFAVEVKREGRCGRMREDNVPGGRREDNRYCWRCRSYYPPETKVCTRCGVDLETGDELAGPEDSGDRERAGLANRLAVFVDAWMPGLLRPGIVILSVITALVGCAIMFFFLLFFPTILPAKLIFAGAGLILYGHAIGFMMSGRPCKLHEALGELSGGQWVLFLTILSLPITVLLGLASVVGGG